MEFPIAHFALPKYAMLFGTSLRLENTRRHFFGRHQAQMIV
jgi:hypothetical protein